MEKKPTLLQHTLMYGAILGIVSIIYSLILYIAGFMPVGKSLVFTGLLSIFITVFFITYGMKSYRDRSLEGNITFGQAFITGFLIIFFSIIVYSIYNFIFNTVIDPEYMHRYMEALKNWNFDLMNRLGASDSQIEEAMEDFDRRSERMTAFRTAWQSTIMPLIIGIIISLIVAAFVKKTQNPIA